MAENKTVSSGMSRSTLLVLLFVCLAAVGVVVYLVLRPSDTRQELIIAMLEVESPREAGVNVSEVIDTLQDSAASAIEGQRYKVLVVDNAREGDSGIARIGGLVTFVPGAQRGDLVVIEVTRLRRSTADSILIERLDTGIALPEDLSRQPAPVPAAETSPLVGHVFRGTIYDTAAEGDGVIRVDGKVVFVAGALKGEHVEFQITRDAGRFAHAVVLSKSAVPYEEARLALPTPLERPVQTTSRQVMPVTSGQVLDVTITETDRRNPAVDGVARIDGFVIFVPGTQPGDQVRIRITDVRSRAASSEVISSN